MKNRTLTSLIIPSVIYIAFVSLHVSFEKNAASIGFSWTSSALIPYILTAVAALLLAKQLGWVLGGLHPLNRKLIAVGSFLALAGIAFGIHPIYEGDFSNTYDKLIVASSDEEFIPEGFSMVALPGCPFCKQRIPLLNKLVEKNENISFQVVLVGNHEETTKMYQSHLSPEIEVVVSNKGTLLSELVGGTFPSFIFKDDKQVVKWGNNGFGTLAMDWVVALE